CGIRFPAIRCARTSWRCPVARSLASASFRSRRPDRPARSFAPRTPEAGGGPHMPISTEPVEVNIGPQHPSTHGVFRMVAKIDGERIVDVKMVVGYLHRSMEKLAEERTFTQNIPFTDR